MGVNLERRRALLTALQSLKGDEPMDAIEAIWRAVYNEVINLDRGPDDDMILWDRLGQDIWNDAFRVERCRRTHLAVLHAVDVARDAAAVWAVVAPQLKEPQE